MPKAPKQGDSPTLRETILSMLPWSSTLSGSHSNIEAYIKATGKWETIARVESIAGIDAEDLAAFIVVRVNGAEDKPKTAHSAEKHTI